MRYFKQRSEIRRGMLVAAVLAALLGLLAACGGDDPTPTTPPVDTRATPTSDAPAKAAWEIEWDETLAKAQEEGELSAALGSGATRDFRPLYKHFQDKFGIRVILSGGSGSAASQRILAERAAGQFTVDVTQTGASSANGVLIPNNVIAPLEPLLFRPDVLDKSAWYQGKFWWGDKTLKYVFIYGANHNNPGIVINTDLVDGSEITSYWDLLDPKYNGMHVSGDLAAAGGSSTFHFLFGHPALGPEFLMRYATETGLAMISDARVAASWMTEGTKAISMHLGGTYSQLIDDLAERGLPVRKLTHSMIEGITLSVGSIDPIMALADPPNPNAQKLFLNWLLSPEGQLTAQNVANDIDSFRNDIPKDMVTPEERRQDGIDYIFVATDPDYQALTQESFDFAAEVAAAWRATQ